MKICRTVINVLNNEEKSILNDIIITFEAKSVIIRVYREASFN